MVLEFDAVKTGVPVKLAFTEAFPAGRLDIVSVALPPDNSAVPIFVEPLKKFTEPVGAVVPLTGFTLAVKVTGEFAVMLAAEEIRLVDVFTTAGFTVMATGPDEDGLKVDDPA